MRLERARFIREIIENAEAISASRPQVKYTLPDSGHFEYGTLLQNHIRQCLATLLKYKILPEQEHYLHSLKQQLSHIIDNAVGRYLLSKQRVIPVSYRETFEKRSDVAEVSRLENIWWYPGLATSSYQNGCHVPVYNTANAATKEAFEYHLKTSLHECLAETLISSQYPFPAAHTTTSTPLSPPFMRPNRIRYAL